MDDEIKKERERVERLIRDYMSDMKKIQREEDRLIERLLSDLKRG